METHSVIFQSNYKNITCGDRQGLGWVCNLWHTVTLTERSQRWEGDPVNYKHCLTLIYCAGFCPQIPHNFPSFGYLIYKSNHRLCGGNIEGWEYLCSCWGQPAHLWEGLLPRCVTFRCVGVKAESKKRSLTQAAKLGGPISEKMAVGCVDVLVCVCARVCASCSYILFSSSVLPWTWLFVAHLHLALHVWHR